MQTKTYNILLVITSSVALIFAILYFKSCNSNKNIANETSLTPQSNYANVKVNSDTINLIKTIRQRYKDADNYDNPVKVADLMSKNIIRYYNKNNISQEEHIKLYEKISFKLKFHNLELFPDSSTSFERITNGFQVKVPAKYTFKSKLQKDTIFRNYYLIFGFNNSLKIHTIYEMP